MIQGINIQKHFGICDRSGPGIPFMTPLSSSFKLAPFLLDFKIRNSVCSLRLAGLIIKLMDHLSMFSAFSYFRNARFVSSVPPQKTLAFEFSVKQNVIVSHEFLRNWIPMLTLLPLKQSHPSNSVVYDDSYPLLPQWKP